MVGWGGRVESEGITRLALLRERGLVRYPPSPSFYPSTTVRLSHTSLFLLSIARPSTSPSHRPAHLSNSAFPTQVSQPTPPSAVTLLSSAPILHSSPHPHFPSSHLPLLPSSHLSLSPSSSPIGDRRGCARSIGGGHGASVSTREGEFSPGKGAVAPRRAGKGAIAPRRAGKGHIFVRKGRNCPSSGRKGAHFVQRGRNCPSSGRKGARFRRERAQLPRVGPGKGAIWSGKGAIAPLRAKGRLFAVKFELRRHIRDCGVLAMAAPRVADGPPMACIRLVEGMPMACGCPAGGPLVACQHRLSGWSLSPPLTESIHFPLRFLMDHMKDPHRGAGRVADLGYQAPMMPGC